MHAEKADRVLIIGKAPASRPFAPYEDKSFEVWTLSDLVPRKQVPRFDRHFELHPLEGWIKPDPKRDAQCPHDYYPWLCSVKDKPVYMHDHFPEIPTSVPYPLANILEYFGPYPYFTNTVSWMIAFAIWQGAETIGVFGVDMAQTVEYREQRPSCEWLLGWAQGKGIEVLIPAECDLLKTPFLYGFQSDGGLMAKKHKARTKELKQRRKNALEQLQELEAQREEALKKVCFLEGALESQGYFAQHLIQPTLGPAVST